MTGKHAISVLASGFAALLLFPGVPRAMQSATEPSPPSVQEQEAPQPTRPGRRGRGRERENRMRHFMRRLMEMSPEEQQDFLANDPQAQRIPAQAKERIVKRLEEFNALPPERKKEILAGMGRGFRQSSADFLQRYGTMAPEDREQALAEDERFQSLPEYAQRRLRRQLQRFDEMPPDQRERFLERMRRFENLPPERRRRIRRRGERFSQLSPEEREHAREVFRQWRGLPDDRRQLIESHLKELRGLAPDVREEKLNQPDYPGDLSAEERTLLRELVILRRSMPSRPGSSRRPPGR